MLGVISFRTYLMIAAFVAGFNSFIVFIDGGGNFGGFFRTIGNRAASFGLPRGVADLVTLPLELAFTDYIWAIGAGLFWPAQALLLLLFVLAFAFSALVPALSRLNDLN
ncbi:MAG: hypothetical protein AAFQ52_03675 [Chloroflexota bacterium]